MKKFIILFVFCFLSIGMNAENPIYKPMLTDGKVWYYITVYGNKYSPDGPILSTNSIVVVGDTVVNDIQCKRLCNIPSNYYFAEYEKDGKIYGFDSNNQPELYIDFTAKPGDNIGDGYICVLSEDWITAKGEMYKRQSLGNQKGQSLGKYWVEGIGSLDNYYLALQMGTADNKFRYLVSCYDNGKCIFDRSDFFTYDIDFEKYVWRYRQISDDKEDIKMQISGDVVIDGKTYKPCYFYYASESFDKENMSPDAYIRIENKKVYMLKARNDKSVIPQNQSYGLYDKEILIYDFNKYIADSYSIASDEDYDNYPDLLSSIMDNNRGNVYIDDVKFRCVDGYQIKEMKALDSSNTSMLEWFGAIDNGYFTYPATCVDDNDSKVVLVDITDDNGKVVYDNGLPPIGYQYKPLVDEGKTWWYSLEYYSNEDRKYKSDEFGLRISGTQEFDGIEWKGVYVVNPDLTMDSLPYCFIREEDKRVYIHEVSDKSVYDSGIVDKALSSSSHLAMPSEPQMLIYDYNLEVGDIDLLTNESESPSLNNNYQLIKLDYIDNSGAYYKQALFMSPYTYDENRITESVGVTETDSYLCNMPWLFILPFRSMSSNVHDSSVELRWVTDADSNILYESVGGYKLWEKDGVGAVQETALKVFGGDGHIVIKGNYHNAEVYDITGRRFDNLAVPSGLYIIVVDGTSFKVAVR
jgi:hypothetical protein